MKPKRFFFHQPQVFGMPLRCGVPLVFGFMVFITGLDAEAGDILRGGAGGGGGAKPRAGTNGGAPTPAATDAARANARDMLARTNRTLDSMRAMQNAARNAAGKGANNLGKNPANPTITLPRVPNGLVTGGLKVSPLATTDPTKWTGAKLPAQTVSKGKTTVTIKQTEQQALLSWETFNIGKDTTLTFDQSKGGENVGQWIAFNKVSDPSANPTQILGNIKADGQVYVINPNGIIFGGSSQVNARGLTVSSLPINENLIERGLLNNPDAQFLFSGLDIPAGINGTPGFSPDKPLSGKYGDVTVQKGAILKSPTNSSNVGGRITLVGANVSNEGSILTPDGQTVLASGLQVGFEGHSSADPSLRGLDVFVGAVADPFAGLYTGTTTQNGVIESHRGAITLAGRDVRQNGALASTTSVSFNGRVDIQANFNAVSNRASPTSSGALFLFKNAGAVELGTSSVISILPEYDSKATTIGTELALRSQINVTGKTIHMGVDSTIAAPNALVTLAAGSWNFLTNGSTAQSSFIQAGGQVYLDRGAGIDVAGSIAVAVPVSQNIISVDLRSAELANSPLQRDGVLRNATIQVDIRKSGDGWIGTPLADVSGFANLIQRSVGQLTVAGGSLTISAGDSVVTREGTKIDVSGGSTFFKGGVIQTTRLITAGRLVNIDSASPDVVYDGIFDGTFTQENSKFGVFNVFSGAIAPDGSRYEPSYTEGAAGGKVAISAPSMAIDGTLSGITVTGERQRQALPSHSSLAFSFTAIDTSYGTLPVYSPTPPRVTFSPSPAQAPAGPFEVDANGDPVALADERIEQIQLSSKLMSGDGFGILELDNQDGDIAVPANTTIKAPAGGRIAFAASNIEIGGAVIAPQGDISLSAYNISRDILNRLNNTSGNSLPAAAPDRGIFTLGHRGLVSAAGLLVNDQLAASPSYSSPLLTAGGSITIKSYSAALSAGGHLDVSGGAYANGSGKVTYGKGGSLQINAGNDLSISAVLGGNLALQSTLAGYSGASAGSLAIQAPAIQIGGSSANPEVTLFQEEFFDQGGFAKFSLSGSGLAGGDNGQFVTGLLVDSTTRLSPVATSWIADTSGGGLKLRGILREEGVRTPVSLTLRASGALDSFSSSLLGRGDVIMEAGSIIKTDAKGGVAFDGETVTLMGSVISPGGTVTVSGAAKFPSLDPDSLLPTVLVGNSARISTAGKVVLIQNALGLRQGQVVAGGTINLSGNIVAERGALFDASGTTGVLDLNPSSASLAETCPILFVGKEQVPVTIDSNGGRISLSGSKMLYSDASLVARAGGASAVGGTLSVSSGRFSLLGEPTNTAEASLTVRQSGQLVPTGFVDGILGNPLVDSSGTVLPGIGNFTVSTYAGGGFDSLNLAGNVEFAGDVTLNVPGSLRLASGGVIYATGQVQLSAGSIAAGQTFQTPALPTVNPTLFTQTDSSGNTTRYQFSPAHGTGSLSMNAKLVDLGDLSLDGIGSAWIDARKGDIRGNGTFQMAGDLTLQAGQIYPPTQRQFSVFVYDPAASQPGSATILSGTSRNLPYSAGGTLSIQASRITQAGVLRAPSGTISLGWDGSGAVPFNPIAGNTTATPVTSLLTLAAGGLTSVSNIDPITGKALSLPFGISLNGTSWIDPAGNDITVTGPPVKSVELAATNLVTEQGSSVDIRGGGDLYAYRWVSGNGGTKDILDSSGSFAIIPGFGFNYSPYAPFNSDSSATNLEGQDGYVNSTLKAGDKITVAASSALAAGTYTLLPARYALLRGAVLVTPKSSVPANSSESSATGASIVVGYRSNDLDTARTGTTVISGFEIAPSSVVRERAEYRDLLANTILRDAAIKSETAIPRLPGDAGYLSFNAPASMTLRGGVSSLAPGRGSVIDINSSSDILINANGSGSGGGLVLNAGILNSFGAESLLIGGLRSFNSDGAKVTVNSSDVTLDNAGKPLSGKDIILVSLGKLTLAEDSAITAPEDSLALDALTLGDPTIPGSGDGTLVRVTANASGQVSRTSIGASTLPQLSILPGSVLSGGGIVLDSTSGTSLAESARLLADDVSLNSGRISIALSNPGNLNPASGLVLVGDALASLQNNAKRLSLLSYSSIDTYGTGTIGSRGFEGLSLQAAAIRGFNTGGGAVTISAASIALGNSSASSPLPSLSGSLSGSLTFDADQITLGANALQLEGFAENHLVSSGILTESTGSLDSVGDLSLVTPLLTGASASKYMIRSARTLQVSRPATSVSTALISGSGADLTLQGATASIDSDIILPSGQLTLRSTSGDLVIGGAASVNLLLTGTSKTFVDSIRYTSGGTVSLISDTGSVSVGTAATIDVSAPAGGGNAGAISVTAPQGIFVLQGSIAGNAGTSGETGGFALDVATIANDSLAGLDAIFNAGGFTLSRDYRIRSGNIMIDGSAMARTYRVATDSGNIAVSGNIDASGLTGGTIDLKAHGSLTLLSGSKLDASAKEFDSAGKGGSVSLEAGNQANGQINAAATLDLRPGSIIDLSVAAKAVNSESLGMFTGTLDLRAPRNAANNDLAVAAIGSSIHGASHILVEGVKLYELSGTGTISSNLQNAIKTDAESFLGAAGNTTAGYSAMLGRLTALNPGLDLILAPGAEIYNPNGSLTLGASNSTASSDWNLSSFRFGPRSAAGVLTLRASENLTFFNALSDGFSDGSSLWLAPLMAHNPLLPANAQSWSLRMTAGADLSAASFRELRSPESLPDSVGFFELGKNAGAATATGGANAQTSSVIGNLFQVIRTGSGNIDIHAGRSLRLLNPFASIYTAGTSLASPTTVSSANDFVIPIINRNVSQGNLGSAQQNYLAQYSMAGGNLTLFAAGNIERKTRNNSGLIDDSSRQLPDNWLYRRGYVDGSGEFGRIRIGSGIGATSDPAASTTWWVDFSNFFQSVGALGGGNVSLTAGRDIMNVDAVIPTNARAPRGNPSASTLVELGGGDLRVSSGRDISGGVYYVERGLGTLAAGGAITTNGTRSPSFGLVGNLNNPAAAQLDSRTWMPTTLFVGKSSFDLTAASDLLLGPVSNPFLLPQGLGNKFWYKTHFSTISPDSSVTALSLGGDVTYRNAVTLLNQTQSVPMLQAWHQTQLLFTGSSGTTAWFQPWLRLAETNIADFSPVWALSAASFSLTSYSGDLNLAGDLTTFPSPAGQLELLAAGSINALQATGLSQQQSTGQLLQNWSASSINLSDADPAAVPSGLNPLTSGTSSSTGAIVSSNTVPGFMNGLSALFVESGSYTGSNAVLQTTQARHTRGGLHSGDSQPLRIYALNGDLSGLTLFSGKQARISASNDITDVAFYIQNNSAADMTAITAGRDITAYNSASTLRVASLSSGNRISSGQTPLAGDIQISGLGTLQVLAGGDLDLGIGSNNPDGTGTGITSIGKLRNPFLPEDGAGIIVGAGIGFAASLSTSSLAFPDFVAKYVNTDQGRAYLAEIAPGVDFDSQPAEEQARLALEVFYLTLRDTGRDFNDPESPGYRKYDTGFDAIKTLFPKSIGWDGEILTQSRNIRTRSGGDIGIFAPGGGLALADTTIGNPLTPPGIVTESGGNISIFTDESVDIGIGRIFTLRGGDVSIWSSTGDIAAGSSSRTVSAAPPTRVVIDPQSASVETDLAGLATGGGIGVLATVEGVAPGDVDLIAPAGIIDAGDAGIRVSGNINLAAVTVVNAGNISAGGSSTGAPAPAAAPSVSTVTNASNAAAATTNTSVKAEEDQKPAETKVEVDDTPSLFTVEVIGYGGGGATEEEEDEDGEKEDEETKEEPGKTTGESASP